jgi:hypothetical protein
MRADTANKNGRRLPPKFLYRTITPPKMQILLDLKKKLDKLKVKFNKIQTESGKLFR